MPSRFIDALAGAERPVVMELKRKSANGLDLFRGRSIETLIDAYREAGAPCLSVVTGRWFGGDEALLHEVRALTDLPILKKDFITRPSQVLAAREAGADAFLLTAKILPRSAVRSLAQTGLELGITPFIEIASLEEIEGEAFGPGCILAVNNKDILDRERGRGVFERSLSLLPALSRTGTTCPVSASGILDPSTAAALLAAGFKGLLVGTSLLLAEDLEGWFDQLDVARNPARAA